MSDIYIPEIEDNWCIVPSSDHIRIYKEIISSDDDSITWSYTDYFQNSHYNYANGKETIDKNFELNCHDHEMFTTSFYYRNDLSDILLVVSLIIFLLGLIFRPTIRKIFRFF